MSVFHTPVLLQEVLDGLDVQKGKRYIDATVGGGGHGVEIVKQGGILLGLDADREAVEYSREHLKSQYTIHKKEEGRDWKIVQGNFRNIEKIAKENGFEEVDGILFDLGVSSFQLDTPGRGFSYRFTDAPLDFRMNQGSGETAAQLVNRVSEEELYEFLARFAEEELARPIARAISRARALKPIRTVGELIESVKKVIRDERKLPATLSRVFQALRIAINNELESLKLGLIGAEQLLGIGGRLVVISFHSLEDRMVKQFMNRPGWQAITKKPIMAGLEENYKNPRARSAKLRIAQKI